MTSAITGRIYYKQGDRTYLDANIRSQSLVFDLTNNILLYSPSGTDYYEFYPGQSSLSASFINLSAINISATTLNVGTISNTEFGYLEGVSANIQEQINYLSATLSGPINLSAYQLNSEKNQSLGYAGLDNNSKIYSSALPNIDWILINNIPVASTSTSGILTSSDWNNFNQIQNLNQYLPLSGGTLSGALVGIISQAISASQSDQLKSARTITISGDVYSSSATFDGSSNISFNLNLKQNGVTSGTYGNSTTVPQIIIDSTGRIVSAQNIAISASGIGSVTSVGINSTTLNVSNSPVTSSGNIIVELSSVGTSGVYTKISTDNYGRVVSGGSLTSSDIPSLNYLPLSGGTLSGLLNGTNISANTISGSHFGNLTGIASQAISASQSDQLKTARSITINGDVSAVSSNFDGSSNISFPLSLNSTGVISGIYGNSVSVPQIIIDNKGRILSANSIAISASGLGTVNSVGVNSNTLSVSNSPITTSGIISLNLSSVGTSGIYTKVSTDSYGRVTSGGSLISSDIPSLNYLSLSGGTLTGLLNGTNISATNISGSTLNIGNVSNVEFEYLDNVSANIQTQFNNISANYNTTVNSLSSYQTRNEKNSSFGYAGLDSNSKVYTSALPDVILGQLHYLGVWNATTNTPTISSASLTSGGFYIVTVSGTTIPVNLNPNTSASLWPSGNIEWKVGDWILSDGVYWDKIDNTDAISTWNGRTGAIIPISGDYNASQITNTPNGNISSITVQAALNELDSEKVPTTTIISAGVGLTGGGDLSTTRTLSLATTGTAGTYTKVVTDIYGRVTSGGNLIASDIPSLNYLPLSGGTLTGLLNGTNISANTISGSHIGNLTGVASQSTSALQSDQLKTARTITISGDVSSVSNNFDGTSNISFPLSLNPTGVTSGIYGNSGSVSQITIDSKGRIVSAQNILISASGLGSVTSIGLSSTSLSVSNSPVTSSGTIVVNLSSVGTPGTYTKVVTNNYGLVTSGGNLIASDIPSLNYLSLSGGTLTGTLTGTNISANNISGVTLNIGNISNTEFGYLDNVSANIQTQFNNISTNYNTTVNSLSSYLPLSGGTLTGNLTYNNGAINTLSYFNSSKQLAGTSAVTWDGLSFGIGTDNSIINPTLILKQNSGQEGGAVIQLNAAGGSGGEELASAKIIIGNLRLRSATNSNFVFQKSVLVSAVPTWVNVWGTSGSALATGLGTQFYGPVSVSSTFSLNTTANGLLKATNGLVNTYILTSSDIPSLSYLPLSGGTLTGLLNGVSISATDISGTTLNIGNISNTEFGYLDTVSANIQTQLNKLSNNKYSTTINISAIPNQVFSINHNLGYIRPMLNIVYGTNNQVIIVSPIYNSINQLSFVINSPIVMNNVSVEVSI